MSPLPPRGRHLRSASPLRPRRADPPAAALAPRSPPRAQRAPTRRQSCDRCPARAASGRANFPAHAARVPAVPRLQPRRRAGQSLGGGGGRGGGESGGGSSGGGRCSHTLSRQAGGATEARPQEVSGRSGGGVGRPRPQASPARWALGGGRGPQGLVPQGDLTASAARPGRDAERERERGQWRAGHLLCWAPAKCERCCCCCGKKVLFIPS